MDHANSIYVNTLQGAGMYEPANNTGTIYSGTNRHYILRTLPHWLIPSVPSDFTDTTLNRRHYSTGTIEGPLLSQPLLFLRCVFLLTLDNLTSEESFFTPFLIRQVALVLRVDDVASSAGGGLFRENNRKTEAVRRFFMSIHSACNFSCKNIYHRNKKALRWPCIP